jgi:MFS transporter, DHA2 family, multidrug resistance protein
MTPAELIAARAALGLAGAAFLPLGLAMLPTLFFDRDERTRAVSIWALASTSGLVLGPIVGGLLLNRFWWGSVFLLNVPFAALGAIAMTFFLPEARSDRPIALDLPGAVLSSIGLGALIFGFINAGQSGWASAGTWVPIVVGLALLAGFIGWERHTSHPLVELGLFSDRNFCWGTVHATIANFAFFGLLFVVPQFFQSVDGSSPFGTGLRLVPMIVGLAIGTRVGSRLVQRAGTGAVLAMGFAIAAAGLFLGATTSVGSGYGLGAAWMTMLGLGVGIALPTSITIALGSLSAERAGAGSGLMQAVRQVGGTLGVALLGTVLASGYRSRLHTSYLPAALAHPLHESVAAGVAVGRELHDEVLVQMVRAAFVHGMALTLTLSGSVVVVGTILAARFLPLSRQSKAAKPEGQPTVG